MLRLLADPIVDRPIIIIVIFIAFFGLIVLGVILIKKFAPAFKNQDTLKSEKEIAQEEVDRLVVDIVEEEKKASKDEDAPSEEEALEYEMNRILETSDEEIPAEEVEEKDGD